MPGTQLSARNTILLRSQPLPCLLVSSTQQAGQIQQWASKRRYRVPGKHSRVCSPTQRRQGRLLRGCDGKAKSRRRPGITMVTWRDRNGGGAGRERKTCPRRAAARQPWRTVRGALDSSKWLERDLGQGELQAREGGMSQTTKSSASPLGQGSPTPGPWPGLGLLGTGPHSRRCAAGGRASEASSAAPHGSHYRLNHTPPRPCHPWKNCLPRNHRFLVPKRLGTAALGNSDSCSEQRWVRLKPRSEGYALSSPPCWPHRMKHGFQTKVHMRVCWSHHNRSRRWMWIPSSCTCIFYSSAGHCAAHLRLRNVRRGAAWSPSVLASGSRKWQHGKFWDKFRGGTGCADGVSYSV